MTVLATLKKRTQVALCIGSLAPYRLSFFDKLSHKIDLLLLLDTFKGPNREWEIDITNSKFSIQNMNSFSIIRKRQIRTSAPQSSELLYVAEEGSTFLQEKILFYLYRSRPKVIISTELGVRTILCLIYAKLTRTPIIAWEEGTIHSEGWVHPAKQMLRGFLARSCDLIWTNGKESKELLLKYNVPPNKIICGMTGVDTSSLSQATLLSMDKKEFIKKHPHLTGKVFVYLASLSKRKGLINFLASLDRIRAKQPELNYSIIFVGSGPLEGLLHSWIKKNGAQRYLATGFVQPNKIAEILAASDWGIIPTLSDNWSLATLELIAAGLPQLFSIYNGATSELFEEDVTGLKFDPLIETEFDETFIKAVNSKIKKLPQATINKFVAYYSPYSQAQRAEASIKCIQQ